MKRLMLIALALIVAPAMANVTIDVVPVQGECAANIVVTADGSDADVNGSLVAGIAIDVTVDAGVIAGVEGFKTSGESVVGDKGYGIYLGTIVIENDAITDVGTPVAPATDPGALGGIGTAGVTLELGALYDQAVPAAAPEGTTILCKIVLSETATVSLAANQTRGGVVLIGGGAPSDVTMNGAAVNCVFDCYQGPDHDQWVLVGKPDSWCSATQCHGDTNGLQEPLGFGQFTWVGPNDVAAVIAAYRVRLGQPGENLACDFDHQQESLGFGQYTRCGSQDVAILIQYYRSRVGVMPEDCNQAPL